MTTCPHENLIFVEVSDDSLPFQCADCGHRVYGGFDKLEDDLELEVPIPRPISTAARCYLCNTAARLVGSTVFDDARMVCDKCFKHEESKPLKCTPCKQKVGPVEHWLAHWRKNHRPEYDIPERPMNKNGTGEDVEAFAVELASRGFLQREIAKIVCIEDLMGLCDYKASQWVKWALDPNKKCPNCGRRRPMRHFCPEEFATPKQVSYIRGRCYEYGLTEGQMILEAIERGILDPSKRPLADQPGPLARLRKWEIERLIVKFEAIRARKQSRATPRRSPQPAMTVARDDGMATPKQVDFIRWKGTEAGMDDAEVIRKAVSLGYLDSSREVLAGLDDGLAYLTRSEIGGLFAMFKGFDARMP